MGAVSGAEQAKAYQKQVTSRLDASRMERHQNLIKGFKEEHDGFTSTTIHDKSDFKSSHGYNRGLRNKFEDGKDLRGKPLYKNSEAKIKQVAKKSEYGNAKGSVSYPKGYPNVEEAAKNPKVLNKLAKNGEKWVVQNCAGSIIKTISFKVSCYSYSQKNGDGDCCQSGNTWIVWP